MSKTNKSPLKSDVVASDAVAAAFALTLTLTSIMVFGQHLTANEPNNLEMSYSESVAQKQAMRETYIGHSYLKPSLAKQFLPKTERARDFDDTVKSEKYWKDLYATISKPNRLKLPKKKSKSPPVVIGSRD